MSLPIARRVGCDSDMQVTAGGAYSPGDVLEVVTGIYGVVQGTQDVASGDVMTVSVEGRWELPCATGVTGSVGAAAYWDASGETVVATPTASTKYIGRFTKAKVSGQLVCEVNINADLPGSGTTLSVAAAGSAQGDAASLQPGMNTVSAADGTKGVILPTAAAGGRPVRVYNEHATNGLKVYPASGDDINDGSADAAVTIEGKTLAEFWPLDATTWAAQFTANS